MHVVMVVITRLNYFFAVPVPVGEVGLFAGLRHLLVRLGDQFMLVLSCFFVFVCLFLFSDEMFLTVLL